MERTSKSMNALQEYLDQNGVTRYQVAKQTGIANTTLANAVKETKPLSGQTVKVITAVAQALGKTPGQVLDDLIELDEDNSLTRIIQSNHFSSSFPCKKSLRRSLSGFFSSSKFCVKPLFKYLVNHLKSQPK